MNQAVGQIPAAAFPLKWSSYRKLLAGCVQAWSEDRISLLGAALAYYTVFSLAPLLILVLALINIIGGDYWNQQQIIGELNSFLGSDTGSALAMLMDGINKSNNQPLASLVGIAALVIGATGVFCQLQDALDTVWHVRRTANSSWLWIILERWTSMLMIFGIGFILLVSLILSAVFSALAEQLHQVLPSVRGMELSSSFVVTIFLFALIFKFIPRVTVPWKYVWLASLITTALFTLGKFALAFYLGQTAFTSAYGAAGSLLIILLWAYYSAQILLIGAEFSHLHARLSGAVLVTEKGYEFITKDQGGD